MKDYQDLLNKLTDTKLKLEVAKAKLKERDGNYEKDSDSI